MTNKMKRLFVTILVLILSAGMFIIPAWAGDYTPEVSIPVTVNLTGTLPETPDVFNIVLTRPAGSSNPMPAGATGDTYVLPISPKKAEGSAVASETKNLVMEFNSLGIYSYTIHQQSIGDDDCYQSTKTYDVTIYITNNTSYDGFETSVAIYERGTNGEAVGGKVPVIFDNRYADPAEVILTAIKTMDKKTPKDKAFTFMLEDEKGKLVEKVQNIGQSVTFSPLVFDEAGTYVYKMSEVKGTSSKISYDKSVYTVTIVVTKDAEGNYQASVSYQKGTAVYEGTPKFANHTKSNNPTTGDMFRMGLWVTLLVGSFAALAALVVLGVKKSRQKPAAEEETSFKKVKDEDPLNDADDELLARAAEDIFASEEDGKTEE